MQDIDAIRERLSQAFKALRAEGLVARQGFLCCRSCAGAALDTPDNQGKGVCYYTRQDRDSLFESGQVYLAYGVVGEGLDDGSYERVGQQVVRAMNDAGLETEWNGSSYTRILVKGLTPPEPEASYLDLVGER